MPEAASRTVFPEISILPSSGISRPAMQRSSVVLPLPDAPRSPRMRPFSAWKVAPCRIGSPPRLFFTLETTSSVMDAGSEAQREREPDRREDDADEGKGRDLFHGTGGEQRDHERADD